MLRCYDSEVCLSVCLSVTFVLCKVQKAEEYQYYCFCIRQTQIDPSVNLFVPKYCPNLQGLYPPKTLEQDDPLPMALPLPSFPLPLAPPLSSPSLPSFKGKNRLIPSFRLPSIPRPLKQRSGVSLPGIFFSNLDG